MGISGSRKIGKMRSLAIVLLSTVALTRANPCQNDQDVYFPDREDCGRFYMCRNGDVVGHMNCPDGLLWNTDLLTCDWPRNVECTPGCPEGWSSVGDSCYFLSRERVGKFSAAQEFCSNMGARLVEINSAEENEAIVGLAEAARSGKNDGLDYWLGGFELAEVSEVSSEESDEEDDEEDEGGEEEDEDVKMGEDEEEEEDEEDEEDEEEDESDSSSQESDHVWQWLSGAPMEYTNWWGEGPDDSGMGKLKGGCIQLLRKGATSPGNLDSYYWARAATNAKCTNNDNDNGVICEM